jgi:hypothetical protein
MRYKVLAAVILSAFILAGVILAAAIDLPDFRGNFGPKSIGAYSGNEPDMPQDIDDPPYPELAMPSKTVSIIEVMEKGRDLPVEFIYNDPNWKRKAFKEYWHSKYHRWSYVPIRLHYAMHRLFTTYPTASVYYDFIHDLGIAEESTKFKGYLPVPPKNKSQKINPFQKIETVIMQTNVKRIVTYGNQVVLVGVPGRTGLQALVIPVESIKPFNSAENILFQLATPQGDELDYSIIDLVEFNEN